VYSETVEPIVPLIFHRTKATCFAYGQTGKWFRSSELIKVNVDHMTDLLQTGLIISPHLDLEIHLKDLFAKLFQLEKIICLLFVLSV
jgi:hypothetical protein